MKLNARAIGSFCRIIGELECWRNRYAESLGEEYAGRITKAKHDLIEVWRRLEQQPGTPAERQWRNDSHTI